MEQKDFFDDAVHSEILERLGRLTAETAPHWGKMNAAQMCAHCAEVIEVGVGKALEGTPWFIRPFGRWIKRAVLAGKPYPRGLRTHPQYVMPATTDFDAARKRLVEAIERMHGAGRSGVEGIRHPLFGPMTADEVAWGMYKHLDHHLGQFGV